MKEEKIVFEPVVTDAQMAQVANLGEIIWHECYQDTISKAQICYMIDKFQSSEAVASQIYLQKYEYFLLVKENTDIGYIGLQIDKEKMFLSKLYLLLEQRGTGLMAEVFSFIKAHGRGKGCKTVWLTVNRHNTRAIAAYKKQGFKQVDEKVTDIGNGFVMDDYILEMPL